MDGMDWLVVGVIAFTGYTASGMAGRHLYWLANRRRTIQGDMTGGDIVGRNSVGSISINGRTFSGNNLSMVGNRIIVDGRDVTDDTGVEMKSILEVKITGDVQDVSCDRGLTIVGTVRGNIDAKAAVNCDSVGGDIKAGGAVNCDDVQGSVYANGSVNCDDIGGSVQAGGSVRHG